MPHLTLEALARLVDEAPTREEQEHLSRCDVCQAELEAMREQTDTLAAMPKMEPPPDLWPDLRKRLRKEGLMAGRPQRKLTPILTRIAAALAVFVAGSATGYAARGPAGTAPMPVASAPAEQDPAAAAGELAMDAPLVGNPSADVERAQEVFAAALDRYMMANSTEAPDPAARLAALDNIVMTTAEALNESPADPVINSYHLTAVAQRNELLRQIAASGEPVF